MLTPDVSPFLPSTVLSTLACRQAAQQSQGIQTLLEAEKEAAKIVQKARTCESLTLLGASARDP
jgi:hypothetical protein